MGKPTHDGQLLSLTGGKAAPRSEPQNQKSSQPWGTAHAVQSQILNVPISLRSFTSKIRLTCIRLQTWKHEHNCQEAVYGGPPAQTRIAATSWESMTRSKPASITFPEAGQHYLSCTCWAWKCASTAWTRDTSSQLCRDLSQADCILTSDAARRLGVKHAETLRFRQTGCQLPPPMSLHVTCLTGSWDLTPMIILTNLQYFLGRPLFSINEN